MIIIVNNNPVDLPAEIDSIADFATLKNISTKDTAIALNGKLVKADKWMSTKLKNMDTLLVISATFGG